MLLIKRADGGVSIMILVDGADKDKDVAKWEKQTGHTAVSTRAIEDTDLPSSKVFRNAWEDNGTVNINMTKAHLIKQGDIDAAMEKRLKDAKTAQARQAIRTASTVNLNSIQTPDELEAFEPNWPQQE